MKKLLKRLLPERAMLWYHYVVALAATLRYGVPSRKMVIIGVTGTKGKTSTINFIWAALTGSGKKVGIISTANIRIGDEEFLNEYHMTMPGRFAIQSLMARMVREGCTHCIVETTSEGIKQSRHVGVYYDIGVFTNLSPEHLQSHGGSFDVYRETKGKMFRALMKCRKTISGVTVPKVIIANTDSEYASYFLDFPADQKITYGITKSADYQARDVHETTQGVSFTLGNAQFSLGILGTFNVYNALSAIAIARLAGGSDADIQKGFAMLTTIPGRMEIIREGRTFTTIVDYAHERESMTGVLKTAQAMREPGAQIIVLLGAEGGGRDKAKRPIMGELAAAMADQVIVSNVDPYEDDPQEIAEDIARSAEEHGKTRGVNLWVILDRREGIRKALSLARGSDIVLITGKGAEQSMIIDGKSIPWDDRTVVREELQNLKFI